MKDIDRYIYHVIKYLPKNDQEDVARELRSNIEDMLDGDYSQENVKRVLEGMGSPYELSLNYLSQDNYLIGPRIYHSYVETLKVLLIVAVVVGSIIFFVDLLTSLDELEAIHSLGDIIGTIIGIFASGIGIMFSVIVGFFFWVTMGFIIAERTNAVDEFRNNQGKTFKVEDLKEIPASAGKKISKVEMAFSLVFTLGFLFILLFRSDLIAVYVLGEGSYPIFNGNTLRAYMPLIILVGTLSVMVTLYKLIQGRWTKRLAIVASIYAFISLVASIIVVMDPHLFGESFVDFMAKNFQTWNVDFFQDLGRLRAGFIAVLTFIFIIEVATALYQGFKKEATKTTS